MAGFKESTGKQVNEILSLAGQKQVPITIIIRNGKTWMSLHSRILSVKLGHIWLQPPVGGEDDVPHEFAPNEEIGLTFKLKHHKYVCAVKVSGMRALDDQEHGQVPALAVCYPTNIRMLQRRVFERVDVPEGKIVRASFWLGGKDAEPSGMSPDSPIWYGQVTDISAGGFQVQAPSSALANLDVGDLVGVRLVFGVGGESVYTDAQFRHSRGEEDEKLLGFQFIGLDQTSHGRAALRLIVAKVNEFRLEARRAHSASRR